MRLIVPGWLVLLLGGFAVARQSQERLPIKQIDHVMWQTAEKDKLGTFLSDTLELPLVWPGPGGDWSRSTGISFGNVDLELMPAEQPTPNRITSLALQPVDFADAHEFLEEEALGHFEPDTTEGRWASIGFRGIGHPMFFIQFLTHDMDARRARFDEVLRNRGGGLLGIERVREVRLSVDQPALLLDQWESLLGPVEPGAGFVWRVGNGPAIRLVDSAELAAEELIVEVASLRGALAAARQLDLVSSVTTDTLRLDPARLGGLVLVLVAS